MNLNNKIYQIQKSSISIKNDYRNENQDSILFIDNHQDYQLAVICDGMGGHDYGYFASRFAVKVLKQLFLKTNFDCLNEKDMSNWLEYSIYQIQNKMKEYTTKHKKYADMGTTLTALLFTLNKVYWIHIGDSRFYFIHNNICRQVSTDQNILNELKNDDLELRYLFNDSRWDTKISGKILVSSLGPTKFFHSVKGELDLNPGYYLLTTDGAHDFVSADFIQKIINKNQNFNNLDVVLEKIVKKAIKNGSKDNISCLILNIKKKLYNFK